MKSQKKSREKTGGILGKRGHGERHSTPREIKPRKRMGTKRRGTVKLPEFYWLAPNTEERKSDSARKIKGG